MQTNAAILWNSVGGAGRDDRDRRVTTSTPTSPVRPPASFIKSASLCVCVYVTNYCAEADKHLSVCLGGRGQDN